MLHHGITAGPVPTARHHRALSRLHHAPWHHRGRRHGVCAVEVALPVVVEPEVGRAERACRACEQQHDGCDPQQPGSLLATPVQEHEPAG